MQFSIGLKKLCFESSASLFTGNNMKTSTLKSIKLISSSNVTKRSITSSQVRDTSSCPSEEDIRRYVVGLSTMKNGTLYPVTSSEQVINFFSSQKPDTIQKVLEKRTKVLQNKLGYSVLEWIY